jgi:hypothetical protein
MRKLPPIQFFGTVAFSRHQKRSCQRRTVNTAANTVAASISRAMTQPWKKLIGASVVATEGRRWAPHIKRNAAPIIWFPSRSFPGHRAAASRHRKRAKVNLICAWRAVARPVSPKGRQAGPKPDRGALCGRNPALVPDATSLLVLRGRSQENTFLHAIPRWRIWVARSDKKPHMPAADLTSVK